MKIKIISEKTIKPISLSIPTKNNLFYDIYQPKNQDASIPSDELQIFMYHRVNRALWEHSCLDLKNELGGSLIGYYAKDPETQQIFILITDVINQPLAYSSDPTELRFTKEFYSHLSNYMDSVHQNHPDLLRLGLYHTHPGYGVFMSQVDKNTFKGIFKDRWQVSLITDPVNNEDGIFYWHNNQITDKTGYYLYDTTDPTFQSHFATTNDVLMAQYNHQLTLNNSASSEKNYPTFSTPKKTINPYKHTANTTSNKPKPVKIKLEMKNVPKVKSVQKTRAHLKVNAANYLVKTCPLYDIHYKSREQKLKKYFVSLSKNRSMNEYPYMIFIHDSVKQKMENLIVHHAEMVGLLKGKCYFDKQKKLHYVEVFDVLIEEERPDLLAFNLMEKTVQKHQAKGTYDILGWFYLACRLPPTLFQFFEKHQKAFHKDYNLGLIVKANDRNELDFEHAQLVAHNYSTDTPFDYFEHLFFCEKKY